MFRDSIFCTAARFSCHHILAHSTGVTTLFPMYYVAETAFRTRKMVQLPSLAERYAGSVGRVLIFLAVALNAFSCLIACVMEAAVSYGRRCAGESSWVVQLEE